MTPSSIMPASRYRTRRILRLDMTAQVHIQLAEVKNVITIPLSAPATR